MIGQAVRHGQTAKDAKNLHAHLMKDRGARVEVINSAAHDLQSAMDDMQLARDTSKADAAFLHLSLSPSRDMTDDELRQVATIVTKHFGAENHPAALVIHDKDRASGKGNAHGHLVIGRVGYDGVVIPSGYEKIKLETAMRIAEFELGEPATLGRHHASAIKWLRANDRADVADWLDLAHGPNPEKPTSPASPGIRQKIERVTGTDLATVTMSVRDAWSRSDNAQAFTAALAESGFEIQKGQKDGVFLVMKDGLQVGALDRLLKEKRRAVASRMEGFTNEQASAKQHPDTGRTPTPDIRKTQPGGEPGSIVVGATGASGGRADSPDSGFTRTDPFEPKTPVHDDEGPRRQSGRFDQIQAARQIEQHTTGWDRLRELRDDLMSFIRNFVSSQKSEPQFSARDHEIARIFENACHYSAENMDRLEKLDPDLSAFREQYGEQCRGLSHEKILENLDAWRDRGSELTSNYEDDNDHDYQPSMRM